MQELFLFPSSFLFNFEILQSGIWRRSLNTFCDPAVEALFSPLNKSLYQNHYLARRIINQIEKEKQNELLCTVGTNQVEMIYNCDKKIP